MNSLWLGKAGRAARYGVLALPFVVVLVVLVASAQAGATKKNYEASVVAVSPPASGTATFTLTLTNSSNSQQTLGSANFTAPAGWHVSSLGASSVQSTPDNQPWNVCIGDGTLCLPSAAGDNVVEFRAATNPAPLQPGSSVSVTATASITCPASPKASDATWSTEAKQSNDFSGQPGNDFLRDGGSLEPLGSFAVSPDPVPQQTTNQLLTVTFTALDDCGSTKIDYDGTTATFGKSGLTGTSLGVTWSGGVATVSTTPTLAESGNSITVTDGPSSITRSTSTFVVADEVCTSTKTCKPVKNGDGSITLQGQQPTGGQKLGLGLNANTQPVVPSGIQFQCPQGSAKTPLGATLALVFPEGYNSTDLYTVTLTYAKSVSGTGPASSFVVCLSKDGGITWSSTPLPACLTLTDHACVVSQKRVSGGALQVVLRLNKDDPYGGLN